jgi:hypothetical protein
MLFLPSSQFSSLFHVLMGMSHMRTVPTEFCAPSAILSVFWGLTLEAFAPGQHLIALSLSCQPIPGGLTSTALSSAYYTAKPASGFRSSLYACHPRPVNGYRERRENLRKTASSDIRKSRKVHLHRRGTETALARSQGCFVFPRCGRVSAFHDPDIGEPREAGGGHGRRQSGHSDRERAGVEGLVPGLQGVGVVSPPCGCLP